MYSLLCKLEMKKDKEIIVLFDGVCILCNGFVNFIVKRDKKAIIKFATLQSSVTKNILEAHHFDTYSINTLVALIDNVIYTKSTAVILVVKELGGFWKAIYIFYFIPKFIRDFFYAIVSKNRYFFGGKKDTCMIPSKEIATHFIQ